MLTDLSESNDTGLILMGTTGLSDVLTKIFGSTSYKVSNQAHCPVILVPRDASWQPIEQIVFASNYDSMTSGFVQNITDFALNNIIMGFIENTYIDTVNNPESTSYEGLYGIGGVILGFGLTFIYDYYKIKKDNRKVGKSFESILVDTKEKCRFQISHIEGYQKEFETNKNAVF